MSNYKDISTSELEKMWNERRLSLKISSDPSVFRKGMDEVFAMRRELDRRLGEKKPSVDVNFEREYVTD